MRGADEQVNYYMSVLVIYSLDLNGVYLNMYRNFIKFSLMFYPFS